MPEVALEVRYCTLVVVVEVLRFWGTCGPLVHSQSRLARQAISGGVHLNFILKL
jgi:hypothetical protein